MAQCDICHYIRQPYEHPDTVKDCNECGRTSYCQMCKDDKKTSITTCCEGCDKCTTNIRCGNCSLHYCIYQCCGLGDGGGKVKECKGCKQCDQVKARGLQSPSPWITHCTECEQNTCMDCTNGGGCHNGCGDGDNIQIAQEITDYIEYLRFIEKK